MGPPKVFPAQLRMSDIYLRASNIQKNYGDTAVLHDISFALEKGKCLALLGPSGCGKSTLLNILAGLMPSDGGRIMLNGVAIEDSERRLSQTAQERRFSMVFQDLSLWPHLTVAENVGFGLDYMALGERSKADRVDEVLRLVGMYPLRQRYPSMLSGGQQQRVAIARAIVVEPSVLLMDEPLASLDTRLREEMRDEIAALIRRLSITTVYVTHDHTEAMTVAHQIAVMNHGQIEQIASPRDILHLPATTFVASFLGSANYFPFTFELEDLRDEAGQSVFPPHPPGIARGFLMVRREEVQIFPLVQEKEFPGDGLIRWRGVCTKTSFTGTRYEVHVRTDKGELFRGFTPEPIQLDTKVMVQFDPYQVFFVEK